MMATKRPAKNSDKNSDPALVVPKHGRGALLTGGKPGNKGGPGRPPSAIRKDARLAFDELLPGLRAIAAGEVVEKVLFEGKETEMVKSARVSDRLKAHDMLGKYGGVAEIALTVEEQPEHEWTPERAAEAWERIKRIKSVEELEKFMVDAAKKQAAANGG